MYKNFIFYIFLTCKVFASPLWYHAIPPISQNYYIGYAQASSESEAKSLALRDIASQISVEIQSSYFKHLELNNTKASKNIVDDTSLISHAKISGYEVLELGYENGTYFIALGFENIPSIEKFNKDLEKVAFLEPQLQNRYLEHTPIAKEISQKIDFRLTRKDEQFYINYASIFVALDDKDFSHFFASIDNENLEFSTSKKDAVLYEGDEFFFKLTSAKEGYVTIFSVYEDGTVSTLVRNIHVKAKAQEHIPDAEYESVLVAGLIHEDEDTFDLYVAVYSKTKQYYDLFARADDALINDERYKNFDELIEMLNEVEFSSMKIVTKGR